MNQRIMNIGVPNFSGFHNPAAFVPIYKPTQSTSAPTTNTTTSSKKDNSAADHDINKRNGNLCKEEKRMTPAYDTSNNPFECDICGAKFMRMKQLHQHKYRHRNQPKWKCEICDNKYYSSKEALNEHMINHNPGTIRHYCKHPGCGKGFYYKWRYNAHKALHAKISNFHCDVCDRPLTTRYSLKRHEKCKEHLARLEKVGSGEEPSGQSGAQSSGGGGGGSSGSAGGGHSGGHQGGHSGGHASSHSGHSKATSHLPPQLSAPDGHMSLQQAILMTNGPSHLHETAGYASHFMAHLT